MAKSYLYTHSLNNIFHMMENGSISTPNFQRGFVWNRELVKGLFESINKGFPIGMLFAVKGETNKFHRSKSEFSYFPDATQESYESHGTLWVMDGSQRLAALYGVLRGGRKSLELFYDLDDKEFYFEDSELEPSRRINMSYLFNAKKFMKFQKNLFSIDSSSKRIEELNDIHHRFQEYQIPIQVIEDVSDDEVAEIFTRLNMSGLTLRKEDIEKARNYRGNLGGHP